VLHLAGREQSAASLQPFRRALNQFLVDGQGHGVSFFVGFGKALIASRRFDGGAPAPLPFRLYVVLTADVVPFFDFMTAP
jgi:hypothetical protein